MCVLPVPPVTKDDGIIGDKNNMAEIAVSTWKRARVELEPKNSGRKIAPLEAPKASKNETTTGKLDEMGTTMLLGESVIVTALDSISSQERDMGRTKVGMVK